MEHPTGRRKRLPFCFIRSNSQHAVRPSCSTGNGYRSSAKALLRACSACCAKGGKLRDGSEGQTGKGTLFPGFRRSGAAEPAHLRKSVPVRLCQGFPCRAGTFSGCAGRRAERRRRHSWRAQRTKTGCTGHTPRSRFSVGFYGILAAVFRRIGLGGFSRFALGSFCVL